MGFVLQSGILTLKFDLLTENVFPVSPRVHQLLVHWVILMLEFFTFFEVNLHITRSTLFNISTLAFENFAMLILDKKNLIASMQTTLK